MKIVMAPEGTFGDVLPMVALSKALREKGHEVTGCGSPDSRQLFEKHGFEFREAGMDFKAVMTDHAEIVADKPIKGFKQRLALLDQIVSHKTNELIEAARGADLIIGCEHLMGGPSVAEYLGIRYCQVYYFPQVFASKHHPPVGMPWQNLPLWANSLLWGSTKYLTKPILKTVNSVREKLGLVMIPDLAEHFTGYPIIIAADKSLAPVPDDVKVDYTQTGYWFFPEEGELDQDLEDFLDTGPAPVYIGFGSMTDPQPEKLQALLKDVIENTEYRFIISKGWANIGADIDGKRVKVIEYAPYKKLFPRVAAAVHHGGAGTIHSAAIAGIPQIIVAFLMDQYYWGEKIFRAKLGPESIKRGSLTAKKLITAINEAVNNAEIINKAKGTRTSVTTNGIAQAVKDIEQRFL